jgi:hypothetical protein
VFRSPDEGATWIPAPDLAPRSGEQPRLADGARHAQACTAANASIYCQGHAVSTQFGAEDAGSGSLLLVEKGRFVHFLPLSGVLCSIDGGMTWAPRCTSRTTRP